MICIKQKQNNPINIIFNKELVAKRFPNEHLRNLKPTPIPTGINAIKNGASIIPTTNSALLTPISKISSVPVIIKAKIISTARCL